MNIKWSAQTYRTVNELITALTSSSVTDGEPNIINLSCQELTQAEFITLLTTLNQAEPPVKKRIKLTGPAGLPDYNTLLEDLYIVGTRQQFAKRYKGSLDLKTNYAATPTKAMRKAKVNLANAGQGPKLGLQFQQQQQQHQKQTRQIKRSKPPAETQTQHEEGILQDDNSLAPFINKAEFLKHFGPTWSGNTKTLNTIWDNLVGRGVEHIADPAKKITHVQLSAMETIVRHHAEFGYGLVFDNLPAGFKLQQTHAGKNVLCFKEEWKKQTTPNPLKITLHEQATAPDLGTSRQFILEQCLQRTDLNVIHAKLFNQQTFTPLKDTPRSKEEFITLLKQIAGQDPDLVPYITNLLDTQFKPTHYQGLANILIQTGDVGVLLFLQKLQAMKKNGAYQKFNEFFLEKGHGYSSFMTENGMANLDSLAEMTGARLTWWETLVEQHQKTGAKTDFNELFTAWQYFLKELEDMGLKGKLPPSCPFENIGHMKTALDRALFILQKASDKEEQLPCLSGLDFGPNGAYYASRNNAYKLVSSDMGLTPDHWSAELPNYAIDTHTFHTLIQRFPERKSELFHRYIGTQGYRFPQGLYQAMEKDILVNPAFKTWQSELLYITALANTGPRSYEKANEPQAELNALLTTLLNIAGKSAPSLRPSSRGLTAGSSDLASNLDPAVKPRDDNGQAVTRLTQLIQSIYNGFNSIKPEELPTLEELNTILISLSDSTSKDDVVHMLNNTLGLFKHYGNAAHAIIANHNDRATMEKEKTSRITAIEFNPLSTTLIGINEQLKAVFVQDVSGMARFATILSMISDPLPDIGNPDSIAQYTTRVTDLANKFLSDLNDKSRQTLLTLLCEINISKSLMLPSFEDLSAIVDTVHEKQAELQDKSDTELKSEIETIFSKRLPDIKTGKEPAKESRLNLGNVIKDFLAHYHAMSVIERHYDNYKMLHKYDIVRNIKETIEELDLETKKEILIEEDVLKKTLVLENLIKELLEKSPWILLKAIKVIVDLLITDPVDKALVPLFFEKKSLAVYLNSIFGLRLTQYLEQSLKVLQTGDPEFNKYILAQLGSMNFDIPVDESMHDFSKHYQLLNGFLNNLIRLKNNDEADYRRCLAILNERQIDIRTKIRLVDVLTPSSRVDHDRSVHDQLLRVMAVLNENPGFDPLKLDTALADLSLITEQPDLRRNARNLLVTLSFKHNLLQDAPFPLKDLIALQTIPNIDKEQTTALFDSLEQVLESSKNTSPETLTLTIKKTTDTIARLAGSLPGIVPLATLLLKKCKTGDQHALTHYIQLLSDLPTDIEKADHWIKILTTLAQQSTDLNTLLQIQTGLTQHDELLTDITGLFTYKPYPTPTAFLKQLALAEHDPGKLQHYINQYDLDPHGKRTKEGTLEEQFSTDNVQRVVMDIKQLLSDKGLDEAQQFDLTRQFIFVNAIGRRPWTAGDKALIHMKRNELSAVSTELINKLRTPDLDQKTERTLNLQLLAVMREQFFRSTGNFPYSTQMISMILSLDLPDNLLMEINTGEGKSITTAMLAAMQWVKGGTIDVCTANRTLVEQDYEKVEGFFGCLGIKSTKIKSDSPTGTRCVDGINYTTVADLSLYRSQEKLGTETIAVEQDTTSHLILDECDYSTLDDQTLFNFAVGAEGGGDTFHNPYAWVYPLINEFIDQPAFRRIKTKQGEPGVWNNEEDIRQVRAFLDRQKITLEQRNQLISLPDIKFDKWLNAACTAVQLEPDIDFIVENEQRDIDGVDTIVAVATPMIANSPKTGATFTRGVQQFIQARLQKKDPARTYAIDAEMLFVATESAKGFIDYYHEHGGRIVGITGTAGTSNELIEQESKFGMVAMSIPPHKKNMREYLDTHVRAGSKEHVNAIQQAVSDIKVTEEGYQPILMIAKDIKHAKALETELRAKFGVRLQLVTGEESEETRKECMENAGKPGTITVSTPLLGRGTDIDPKHKDGLFVIQTFLDTVRTTRQIIGRAARNGKVGKYLAIYEGSGGLNRHWLSDLLGINTETLETRIKSMQEQMNQEKAVQRHFIQEVDGIQQTLFKQFDAWQALLLAMTPERDYKALKTALLPLREKLIVDLADGWHARLEQSDPEQQYLNPYIRRDKTGNLDTSAVSKQLKAYETEDVITIWNAIKEQLIQKKMAIQTIKPLDEIRVKTISNIDLAEELKLRKMTTNKLKKVIAEKRKHAIQHIQLAFDEDAAILHHTSNVADEPGHQTSAITEAQNAELEKPDVVKNRYYLSKKASQLKCSLNKIWGENRFERVVIKHKHTGFSEHFDLVITGTGFSKTFTGFERYNSSSTLRELQKDLQEAQQCLVQELASVHSFIIDGENIRDKIKAISDKNLRIELLKHMSQFKIAINKRKAQEQELRDMEQRGPTWMNFFSTTPPDEILSKREKIEALRAEAITHQVKFNELITSFTAPEISQRILLITHLIEEETNKSKTMVKRFNYLDELLDYEAKVRLIAEQDASIPDSDHEAAKRKIKNIISTPEHDARKKAITDFNQVLNKIITRFCYLSPEQGRLALGKHENMDNDSDVVKYIRTLHETTVELKTCMLNYPDVDMNQFIDDFSKKMSAFDSVANSAALDLHYASEHLYNFINFSLYTLTLAFANLVYIISPEKSTSMIKTLQEKGPVQYGIKTEREEAKILLEHMKTPAVSDEETLKPRRP